MRLCIALASRLTDARGHNLKARRWPALQGSQQRAVVGVSLFAASKNPALPGVGAPGRTSPTRCAHVRPLGKTHLSTYVGSLGAHREYPSL